MNTPLNAVTESAVHSQGMPPAAVPRTRLLYWSVRRELWENRSIYIAPLVVAAFVVFASLISMIGLPRRMQALAALEPAKQHAVVVGPLRMAPASIMLAAFLVGIFYSLDALYGERRDRSILFYKSLPVSDLTTVLSKASIPLVVLPVVAYVLSVAINLSLLLGGTAILLGSGVSAARYWAEAGFFQGLVVMFYGLAVHSLWLAPIYSWLLLVSAWARRTPVLWAGLPLLAISVLESIAFRTSHFASLLKYRVTGAMAEAFSAEARNGNVDRLTQLDPAHFLRAPGLWIGLATAVGFLAAAVRLRRNREPI